MKFPSRKRWTKAEKWLLSTPALVGIFAVATSIGPGLVRKQMGFPDFVLQTAPGVQLTSIALSGDGRFLAATALGATVPQNGNIWIWNARTLNLSEMWPGGPRNRNGGWASRQPSQMQWSKDGTVLFFGRTSEPFHAYKVASRHELWSFGEASFENSVRLSPDGRWLFVPEKSVRQEAGYALLDASNGRVKCHWKVRGFTSDPYVSFSPDGKTLACIGPRRDAPISEGAFLDGRDVEIRRVDDGKLVSTLHCPWTRSVEFSPDGSCLLVVGEWKDKPGMNSVASHVTCFALDTMKSIWSYGRTQADFPSQGVWSPDGTMVAAAVKNNRILLLDAGTGEAKATLSESTGPGNVSGRTRLVFSPDGKRFFAQGKDAVQVWDLD